MKKKVSYLLFCLFLMVGSSYLTSCSPGYGCPTYGTKASINGKGDLSTQRGSSNLFPKKMRGKKK